jgi:hypothetical protein
VTLRVHAEAECKEPRHRFRIDDGTAKAVLGKETKWDPGGEETNGKSQTGDRRPSNLSKSRDQCDRCVPRETIRKDEARSLPSLAAPNGAVSFTASGS